jgi:hypothetical protein
MKFDFPGDELNRRSSKYTAAPLSIPGSYFAMFFLYTIPYTKLHEINRVERQLVAALSVYHTIGTTLPCTAISSPANT